MSELTKCPKCGAEPEPDSYCLHLDGVRRLEKRWACGSCQVVEDGTFWQCENGCEVNELNNRFAALRTAADRLAESAEKIRDPTADTEEFDAALDQYRQLMEPTDA